MTTLLFERVLIANRSLIQMLITNHIQGGVGGDQGAPRNARFQSNLLPVRSRPGPGCSIQMNNAIHRINCYLKPISVNNSNPAAPWKVIYLLDSAIHFFLR